MIPTGIQTFQAAHRLVTYLVNDPAYKATIQCISERKYFALGGEFNTTK